MKFTLTITDATKEEIAAILGGNPPGLAGMGATVVGGHNSNSASVAALNSNGAISGATSAVPMPSNGGAPSNDDDNGPANVNAPAVDAAGLPWDERIHSKNKAMNADGTWRKRRNVDGNLVVSVEAELRQRMPQQTQQPVMQSQPAPQMMQMPQTMQQPAPQMQMPNGIPPMPEQQMQQHQPMMQQQPVTPQPQQPGPMDFNAFMTHLAGQMAKRDQSGAPLITTDYLASVAQFLSQQFNSITDIAGDANVIAAAVNKITIDGRWH